MSNSIFPTLQGLTMKVSKTPSWPTDIQSSQTGKETRVKFQPTPRWSWTLEYEFLMDDRSAGLSDLQKLAGFWLAHQGELDSFLYADPNDYIVTDHRIGTGNGSKTAFQLGRSLALTTYEYVEPITEINGAVVVKVNGTTVSATLGSLGVVTLAAPPANGAAITASFSYYWRVRFASDLNLNRWIEKVWTTKSVTLLQVLP